MNKTELKEIWKNEEKVAHIHGWDFSHIHGRYEEEMDLPWDYKRLIEQYINNDMYILDYDTGGGEFLLSLNHPYNKTAATEGYQPNVELCKETLLPLGIDFKACDNPANIPFQDESFNLIINRHGDFDAKEIYRLLKKGGLFRIATDHPIYKRHVLRTMHNDKRFVWTAKTSNDWRLEPSDWVKTKYQMKAIREGRRPVWFNYLKG